MNSKSPKGLILLATVLILALLVITFTWSLFLSDSKAPTPSTDTGTTPMETTETTVETTAETTVETTVETTTEGHQFVPVVGKKVALTFDDGPSLYYTPEILDLLEKYDAKATFFVCGYQINSPEKQKHVKRAIDMGCEIGNHTENHKTLTSLSDAEILDEITRVSNTVKSISGGTYEISLLRPPGGAVNRHVMDAMYDGGLRMHTVLWDNDSMDWSHNRDYLNDKVTREEAIQATYDEIMRQSIDGGIILMHDIKGITPDVLAMVLETLSKEGYQFVTVSELIDFASYGQDAYFSKFYGEDEYRTVQ